MRSLLIFLAGMLAGYAFRHSRKEPTQPRRIMPKLIISATEEVLVRATIQDYDAENEKVGDPRPAQEGEYTVSIENANDTFGSLDGVKFNPGSAGGTGTLVVTSLDGKSKGTIDIELQVGAVTHSEVEVALEPLPIEPASGQEGSPVADGGTAVGATTQEPETPATEAGATGTQEATPTQDTPATGEGEATADATQSVVDKIMAMDESAIDTELETLAVEVPEGTDKAGKAQLLADAGYIPQEAIGTDPAQAAESEEGATPGSSAQEPAE